MKRNMQVVDSMIDLYYKVNFFVEPSEEGIDFGMTTPSDTPDATIRFFQDWIRFKESRLKGVIPFSADYAKIMDDRFISYDEFKEALRHDMEQLRDDTFLYHRFYEFYMISNYADKRSLFVGIQDNYEGYRDILLKSKNPVIRGFLDHPLKMMLPVDALQRHTHILGKTGQGKSNLIKLLIYRLLQQAEKQSIVLIEPHGDLSSDILDLADHIKDPSRLVYIDPYYDETRIPVFNPLETKDKSQGFIDKYSQELTKTFVELLKDGATLTGQMEAVLRPAISTLLFMEDTTLKDLQDLMDLKGERKKKVIEKGLKNPFPMHRTMFKKVWGGEVPHNYKTTVNSIYTKIQTLFNTDIFYRMTCGNNGRSTIDLTNFLDEGKTIVFNLSKGLMGSEASEAFGKFIVSNLQTIAFDRAKDNSSRTPCYIFIDEFQNYVTESISMILSEARKYGMHMILSHQSIGQISDSKIKDTILGNTAIKIIGRSNSKTLKAMSEEIDLNLQEFKELEAYEFYVDCQSLKKKKNSTPFRVKPSSFLVNRTTDYYQTQEEQQALKRYILKKYYASKYTEDRPVNTPVVTEDHGEARQEVTKPKFDL